MQAYLEIEKARFGDRLRFSVDARPTRSPIASHIHPPAARRERPEVGVSPVGQRHDRRHPRLSDGAGVLEIEVMNNGHLESTPRDKAGGLGLDTLSRRLVSITRGGTTSPSITRLKSSARLFNCGARRRRFRPRAKKTSHLALSLAESEPVPQGSTLP